MLDECVFVVVEVPVSVDVDRVVTDARDDSVGELDEKYDRVGSFDTMLVLVPAPADTVGIIDRTADAVSLLDLLCILDGKLVRL